MVPLQRIGRRTNARNALFAQRHNSVHWVEWRTDRANRLIRTRVLVWKRGRKTRVFAFGGWAGRRAGNVHRMAQSQRRLYRKRFGIETSYRQKNQGLATTTRRDATYRLLLQGIAFLLRQVWVALTEELGRRTKAKPSAWLGTLTLARVLEWLAEELKTLYPEDHSIPLGVAG